MIDVEFMLEIEYYDPTVPGLGTIYATTSKGFNLPSAPAYYLPTIKQAANLDRTIWENDMVFGSGKMALGDAVLSAVNLDANASRPYDFLVANGCSVGGRNARLLIGPKGATNYSEFENFYTGTMGGFSFSDDGSEVSFRWRDAIADLVEADAQYGDYLGNNALPDGVEGVADIKGQKKTVCLGECPNVRLVCVNTSRNIYFVSDNLIDNDPGWAVFIKASNITQGTSRANTAALEANVPTAGTYDYVLDAAGSYVRFASAPSGEVTSNVYEGATAADRTVAQLWKRALISWGVDPANISAADVSALDALQPGVCGYSMGSSPEKRREVLDKITKTAGAIYWRDQAGVWRIKRVEAASGTPVVRFRAIGDGTVSKAGDVNIINVSRTLPNGNDGEPVSSTTLNYKHNFTVQSKDALAGIGLVNLQFVSMAWRTTPPSTNATIAAQYLNSRVVTEDTYFIDPTVAATEADRRQALRGAFRSLYIVDAQLTIDVAELVQELSVVSIQWPFYGLAAGKIGIVVRIQYDAQTGVGKYTVYV